VRFSVAESIAQGRGRRWIGRRGGPEEGPTLVCVAAIHGNEPSGVAALERVFADLERRAPVLRGTFVGLTGNLSAYDASVRYLAKDLNRQWTARKVSAIERMPAAIGADAEDAEQRELLSALREIFAAAKGPVTVLDLHSASSVSAPFLIFGDTLKNREFAMRFPSPVVLGLEEMVTGTIMEWVSSLGHSAVAFEAGQHDDPVSVERQEAAIRIALEAAEILEPDAGEALAVSRARETLEEAARDIPRVLEIVDRHAITPEDAFVMNPGFSNFARVDRGDALARDRRGEIRSPGAFTLLFPLYQKLGDDGFFLARPVNPIWLAVSSALRRLHAGELAHFLPGVAKHPDRRDTLIVDRRIARFGARQIFHLLGYRVEASRGHKVIVRKRDRKGT
jgi:succinylglutamate desuccinylase